MKIPDFEILISTMNRTDLDFLHAMLKDDSPETYHILIINQTTKDKLLKSTHKNIRVINAFEKGLSKSRNLALKNAVGTICLLADDDTCFIKGFDRVIQRAFQNYASAALISFQVTTFEGGPYRNYPETPKALTRKKDILPLSSVEIAFKRDAILRAGITFNELFGLGSYFEMGEEYLFARDVLQSKLNIDYVPEKIVKHSKVTSTSDYGNDKVLYANGALTYMEHKKTAMFWLLKFVFFLARKRFIRWNAFASKFRLGLKGMRDYKNLVSF